MLLLKENKPEYWDFIREVRSAQENQHGFVENVQVTKEQQLEYMKKHNNEYYVCVEYLEGLDYELPVGFIGSVNGDIRLAVKPEFHGKGVGKFMLMKFVQHVDPNVDKAKVKHENVASHKVFKSCGFTIYREDDNFKYYRLYEI